MAGAGVRTAGRWRRLAPLLAFALGAGAAQAADLDHRYYPPPRASAGDLPPPPGCRLRAQPQMNLYNEVTRFGVQWVCISRGVYADSFWPYPPPYWARPRWRSGY